MNGCRFTVADMERCASAEQRVDALCSADYLCLSLAQRSACENRLSQIQMHVLAIHVNFCLSLSIHQHALSVLMASVWKASVKFILSCYCWDMLSVVYVWVAEREHANKNVEKTTLWTGKNTQKCFLSYLVQNKVDSYKIWYRHTEMLTFCTSPK